MASDEGVRKLAAILSADVVGYSKLMSRDERATVKTLKEYRSAITRVVERRKGRVVDSPGDNILADFPSAVEAVQSAVEILKVLEGRNLELPTDRRMEFRIGVNLGDVIEEQDGTIYGDGVNIAARMEALAEAGGICISNTVYDAIEGKVDFGFDFLGAQTVKNIDRPINVYRVRAEPGHARRVPSPRSGIWRWFVPAAIGVVVVAIGLVAWQLIGVPPSEEKLESDKPETVDLAPTKPTIAVLPFANLSQDADQEWFADGLTESLITDLAKLSNVLVIARNSVFRYKGKPVDVQQVSRELGANYVVEGSVQTTDDIVRINAQIIDGSSGTHVWSERYDRGLAAYFGIQDEIVEQIIASLDIAVLRGERARLNMQSTDNLEAYEFHRRATELHYDSQAVDCPGLVTYRDLMQKALELDPNYSSAHVGLASYHYDAALYGCLPAETSFRETVAWSNKAIEVNPLDAEAYAFLSIAHMSLRDFDEFVEAGEKAFELSPNNVVHLAVYAWGLTHVRRYERAKLLIEKAIRLQPFHDAWWLNVRAMANFWLGDYETALEAIDAAYARTPHHTYTLVYKTVILSAMGQTEAARTAGDDLVNRHPDFSIEDWLEKNDPFQNLEDANHIQRLLEEAGVS